MNKINPRQALQAVALALIVGWFANPNPSSAATLEVFVAGYYGGNQNAGGSVLPSGTSVELGVFYSGGVFTTSASVSNALASVATTSQWSDFRVNAGWVSFGSGIVGANGDFQLSWSSLDNSAPGLGSEFDLNPTTGVLATKSLIGVIPFLWVQTANSTESGLYVSNQAFPTNSFGASFQIDATTGDAGVTALRGTVTDSGIKTAALSVGTSSNTVAPTLRLMSPGTPVFSGGNTVVTHTFAVNSNGPYTLEYKSSLTDNWRTSNVTVSNSNNFSVTFTNGGVNTTNEWGNRMFFRIKNG